MRAVLCSPVQCSAVRTVGRWRTRLSCFLCILHSIWRARLILIACRVFDRFCSRDNHWYYFINSCCMKTMKRVACFLDILRKHVPSANAAHSRLITDTPGFFDCGNSAACLNYGWRFVSVMLCHISYYLFVVSYEPSRNITPRCIVRCNYTMSLCLGAQLICVITITSWSLKWRDSGHRLVGQCPARDGNRGTTVPSSCSPIAVLLVVLARPLQFVSLPDV